MVDLIGSCRFVLCLFMVVGVYFDLLLVVVWTLGLFVWFCLLLVCVLVVLLIFVVDYVVLVGVGCLLFAF